MFRYLFRVRFLSSLLTVFANNGAPFAPVTQDNLTTNAGDYITTNAGDRIII